MILDSGYTTLPQKAVIVHSLITPFSLIKHQNISIRAHLPNAASEFEHFFSGAFENPGHHDACTPQLAVPLSLMQIEERTPQFRWVQNTSQSVWNFIFIFCLTRAATNICNRFTFFFFLALKRSSVHLSLWESSIIWKHTHNWSVWFFFYMISTSVEDKGSSFWFLKTRSYLKFESNLLDLSHDLDNSKHVQKHCLYHTFLKLIWLIIVSLTPSPCRSSV